MSKVETPPNETAADMNDDTRQSSTPHVIGEIEGYPVYDWKSYPYGPNASDTNDTAMCYFVKKPEAEAENNTRPAFTLKLAYSYPTYGTDRRAPFWVRKQCMGVFQCRVKRCTFLATPVRGTKKARRPYQLKAKIFVLCIQIMRYCIGPVLPDAIFMNPMKDTTVWWL